MNINKDDMDSTSKRRKLKREHILSEPGEFLPAMAPTPPPLSINLSQSHDGRDRGDHKGIMVQRPGYMDESGMRIHGKEAISKTRRDIDLYPWKVMLSLIYAFISIS